MKTERQFHQYFSQIEVIIKAVYAEKTVSSHLKLYIERIFNSKTLAADCICVAVNTTAIRSRTRWLQQNK